MRASVRGADHGELARNCPFRRRFGSRVRNRGPALIVRPDAAQTLAMTISELGSVAIEQTNSRDPGAYVTQGSLPDGWRCEIVRPMQPVTANGEGALAEPLREPANVHDVGPA
ncbi:MAG: hypothetical protein K2Y29_16195 [Beijerinckiaceae bacterium]|nr:hypothetical protein [Beijerinckiaceae bacterium]